jgi:hypothetical protein
MDFLGNHGGSITFRGFAAMFSPSILALLHNPPSPHPRRVVQPLQQHTPSPSDLLQIIRRRQS